MLPVHRGRLVRIAVKSILGAASLSMFAAAAYAQESAAKLEEVVVTGYRAAVIDAIEAKRESIEMVDVINAEDIAKFPDSNLAESLQRLPGVSIDRENGEGRSITVRGLGGDFTTVRLNGIDALATAGGNESGAAPNRSRGFDFNTFASDLFSQLKVQKTASAATDEGSLGATVDLTTGRPLNYGKQRLAFSAEGGYYENGENWSPRLSALASDTWFDNTLGALVSASYATRDSDVDSFQRNPGVFDYTYRNSQHLGQALTAPAVGNVFGFAQSGTAPAGRSPGTFGSDATAIAQLNDTTLFPALGTLSHQDLEYQRLGLTGTVQWKPADGTLITADYVHSNFHQDNVSYQLTTVGLNRNGTNARAYNLATAGTGLGADNTPAGLANRRAVYVRCDRPTNPTPSSLDCGQTLNGGGMVPGTSFSFNPNNLDPFDYYNQTVSPGYIADPNRIAYYNQLLGRPGSQVVGAHVNGYNQADYLALNNVDWRNAADGTENDTEFNQISLNVSHEFTNSFRGNLVAGHSKSEFDSIGLLVEFNSIDSDGFVYDERGGGSMPVFQLGFDPNNTANWDLVKGLSTIRYFSRTVDNEFKTARLEFDWDMNEKLTFNFGGTWRVFDFANTEGRRNTSIEAINPTLREANLTIGQLGQNVSFGQGMNLSAGAPTSWFAPNLDAFKSNFGIDCNCINQWSDWRGAADARQQNEIQETDKSLYLQATFDLDLFGRQLRGNVGVRYAMTGVEGSGVVGTTPVDATNDYDDVLPSVNLSYEVVENLLVRVAAAKVMSRPLLANLTPGTTAFTTTCTANVPVPPADFTCAGGSTMPSITMGNPYLEPFRADNYDLSVEWYFGKGGSLAAAVFRKEIDSFPQQLLGNGPLSSAIEGTTYDQVLAGMRAGGTNGATALANYTDAGGTWAIRQYKDSPGGFINGIELSYSQNFTDLPWPFNGMGVQANYTHIESELKYIVNGDTGASQIGPWLNVSPDAFNATVFYENDLWDVRLSGAFRKEYVRQFPISTGICEVGTTTAPPTTVGGPGTPCNAPIFADFIGVDDSFNLDLSAGINVGEHVRFKLDVLNITNQTTDRWLFGASHQTQMHMSTGRIYFVGARLTF
jgi:iron complex outermembrane recepter protein